MKYLSKTEPYSRARDFNVEANRGQKIIIYIEDQLALDEAANKIIASMEQNAQTPEEQKKAAQVKQEWEEFKTAHEKSQRKLNEDELYVPPTVYTAIPYRFTYREIKDYMRIFNLTYKDILEITTSALEGQEVTVDWPDEISAKMCALCDSLTDAQRQDVFRIVHGALSDARYELLSTRAPTLYRSLMYTFQLMPRTDTMFSATAKDPFLKSAYSKFRHYEYRNNYLALPFSRFKIIADYTKASYHWLMGLEKDECVLAKNAATEVIMDTFCVLPEDSKQYLYRAIKEYFDGASM